MRLTKKKAIQISIELWTWLAETGRKKSRWEGWKKYGKMRSDCALCQYRGQSRGWHYRYCPTCPYYKMYGCCYTPKDDNLTPYLMWEGSWEEEDRKKYAALFLEQLMGLK